MEFHLPYYALRTIRGESNDRKDPRDLRRSADFGFDDPSEPGTQQVLFEAQISLLVTGVDEWFWTACLCVDTYFEDDDSVHRASSYHSTLNDALIGGYLSLVSDLEPTPVLSLHLVTTV